MSNQDGRYRPLRGGVAIFNPQVNEFGTLGMIATSDGTDAWIVSCYHVLCAPDAAGRCGDQRIFQPFDGAPEDCVAITADARADRVLDCAAARVIPGVDAVAEILGIGPLGPPVDALIGMEVIKAGMATGVTEGVVDEIDAEDVRVRVIDGFPRNYDLSGPADSGSIWVDKRTRGPVVLHAAGNDTGREFARGKSIRAVLAALRLRMV